MVPDALMGAFKRVFPAEFHSSAVRRRARLRSSIDWVCRIIHGEGPLICDSEAADPFGGAIRLCQAQFALVGAGGISRQLRPSQQ